MSVSASVWAGRQVGGWVGGHASIHTYMHESVAKHLKVV